VQRLQTQAHNGEAIMAITAAALISTLASQASSSTNRQAVATPAVPQRPSLADTATISQASQAVLAAATGSTSGTQSNGTTSGLGAVTGVSGTQYDFTNMTNAQAYAAAGQLGDEGKISVLEQSQLQAMAQGGGSLSINPSEPGTTYFSDNMKSTTPQNYLTNVSNQLSADIRGQNAKGIAMDSALLTALSAYQETAESASETSATTGIVSTTA
jgi:hypothetical protein